MQAADTLWWQVYPLGALGAASEVSDAVPEPANGPGRLIGWLDHVIELGLNGLALGPIFASSTHGYDTTDHLRIDPRIGDDADFDELVAQCRERGIRLILDGVFNHVGEHHPLFEQAVAEGPDGPTGEYFRLYWNGEPAGTVPDYECFEGHRQLVTLNHASPKVVDLVVEAMCHWLERGADGWRLDAAYAVPTEFWAQVLPRVRERHPGCYIMGEVIHGDYPQIVRDAGFDAVTQYELWKSIWSSLNDQNFHELAWNLQRNNDFLDTFIPWTFISNHDVTRIASRLNRPECLPHATALLWTLPGSPAAYYGDEFGWRGVKEDRVGGDDAVRPMLPEAPAQAEVPSPELPDLYRELISLRRRHPWLHHARTEAANVTDTAIWLDLVADEGRLALALNIDDQPAVFDRVLDGAGLLAGTAQLDGHQTVVPGLSWAILQPGG